MGLPLTLVLGTLGPGSLAHAQDAGVPPPSATPPSSSPTPAGPPPATEGTPPAAEGTPPAPEGTPPAPEGTPPTAEAPNSLAPPPPADEAEVTQCGDKQVGTGEGQLRPLGRGFYADGNRVRRGCTLLMQRPLKLRPPLPFSADAFRPLGCGFIRYATSVYWYKPLGEEPTVGEANGQRADVLTRLELADASSFEVDDDCRARDGRFFYLNHTDHPDLPSFVAVPRGDGQGYDELGCGFVRFEGKVYFGVRQVEGAHVPSFTSVLGRLPDVECGAGTYGKDRSKVWWRGQPLRGVKPKTFRVPKEGNPGSRVSCDGKRSFLLGVAEKKPNPVCTGPVKKPTKRVKGRAG